MLLFYLPVVTNRAKYILSLYFTELLGLEYSLTTSLDEYTTFQGAKIFYSTEPSGDGLFIRSVPLLFSQGLQHLTLSVGLFQGLPTLFGHEDIRSCLPFDPFASGFFMVTRYEEYLKTEKDHFGRFRLNDSIANEGKFIGIPVVNLWANLLLELIQKQFPDVQPHFNSFRFIPSIDIDHAYAFGHRTITRTLGGFIHDIQNVDFVTLKSRIKVLLNKEKDPYDNYSLIKEIHDSFDIKPLYFILFADYDGNDNNVSLDDIEFQELIKKLDMEAEVGIHPSMASNKSLRTLENEVFGLSDLIDRDVSISRQHFLKIKLPWTYRNLIRLEITDDYSMGFASAPGFRAGIANSFLFFDVINDETTELRVHPVTIMDVTLKDYLKLDFEASLIKIKEIIDVVKSVNGEFVSLWHNESFSDTGRWKGWLPLYTEMLKYIFT